LERGRPINSWTVRSRASMIPRLESTKVPSRSKMSDSSTPLLTVEPSSLALILLIYPTPGCCHLAQHSKVLDAQLSLQPAAHRRKFEARAHRPDLAPNGLLSIGEKNPAASRHLRFQPRRFLRARSHPILAVPRWLRLPCHH